MSNPIAQILASAGRGVRIAPCVVATASPPAVTIEGVTVPAVFVTGLTYAPAAPAVAFLTGSGNPLALPVTGV